MSDKNRAKKTQQGINQGRRRAMPSVWQEDEVMAILLADIHLSLRPPIWRSNEPDWFEAMARPLLEVKKLQSKYKCPVICAGDIFDKWSSLPELINFAYKHLFKMYAIPGQHDLPLHNYKDINKSAYMSLVHADVIQNILPDSIIKKGNLFIHGFPFGYPIKPLNAQLGFAKQDYEIHIAVVHEYKCIEGKDYNQAPDEAYLRMTEKNLDGYDVIMYGDNHKGFMKEVNPSKSVIFNCGTLMRRKSDEIDYNPQIGLLMTTGAVIPYCLTTHKDKHLQIQKSLIDDLVPPDLKIFIQELKKLGATDLDFHDTMKQYLKRNKISENIANIILEAMGL